LLIYQRNAFQAQDEHLMVVRISGKLWFDEALHKEEEQHFEKKNDQ
jgi:hypothetical protein